MDSSKKIPHRPLGLLTGLVESAGFQVTHVYEDLMFIEHNAFLFRMEEDGADVSVFFNTESEQDKRPEIFDILEKIGAENGFSLTRLGCYRLDADEQNQTIDIVFLDGEM